LVGFNAIGQQVSTLVNEYLEAGNHVANWDESSIPSGGYFYRIRANGFVGSKKMVLLN
jgi:hypothetical protein